MEQPLETQERHQSPRYYVFLSGTIESAGNSYECELLNVSEGGAKVRLIDALPGVDTNQIKLTVVPHGTIKAEVTWREDEWLGLEFDAENDVCKAFFQSIINNPEINKERRGFPRTSVLWTGRLHAGNRAAECRVLNVSALGAKIRLLEPLQHDNVVSLMIDRFGEFPSDVIWQEGEYLGIDFQDDPDDIVRIIEPVLPAIRLSEDEPVL